MLRAGDAVPDAMAVGDLAARKVYAGDNIEWVPLAGSSAVDAFLGAPVQTINPDQVLVQLTVAGTPFPEGVELTSDRGGDESAYLRRLLSGQTSGRAVVQVRILRGADTPDGQETWTFSFFNGRTRDTATLPVTWPPR